MKSTNTRISKKLIAAFSPGLSAKIRRQTGWKWLEARRKGFRCDAMPGSAGADVYMHTWSSAEFGRVLQMDLSSVPPAVFKRGKHKTTSLLAHFQQRPGHKASCLGVLFRHIVELNRRIALEGPVSFLRCSRYSMAFFICTLYASIPFMTVMA